MQSNFLIPLKKEELEKIFDSEAIEILTYYLKISVFSQPHPIIDTLELPIQIPKEHLEQFVVQCLGCRPMGAGSYPVDVIDDARSFASDIKMLSCLLDRDGKLSSQNSGETSLAQKFSDNDLDGKFRRLEHQQIINDWIIILQEKYCRVLDDNNKIKDIYYFFILRAEENFFLIGTKLDVNNIKNLTLQRRDYTKDSNSIYIENVIDSNFGHAKIYKAKKRLELRLKPSTWEQDHSIKIKLERVSSHAKLRGLGDDGFKKFKKLSVEKLKGLIGL